MNTNSFWIETAGSTGYPKLDRDLRVDALVIGAGITGMTAAYLLRKAGLTVAVIDRRRIGLGQTGHTTAHLTYVTDTRLSELVNRFGRDHAQAVWEASASAMAQIQVIVEELGVDCELSTAPGFLVAAADAEAKEPTRLRDEATLAAEFGFDATFVESAPLSGRPAMRVANQLKFHPLKYVQALAKEIVRLGGHLFEETDAGTFTDDPRRVTAGGHNITFNFAVFATHVPLQGNSSTVSATLLQTKIAAYSTYAIEARVALGTLSPMLWWDTADPYAYLRVDRRESYDSVIFGGEDHRTGQKKETDECFRRLEEKLRDLVPEAVVEQRWSGQVIESVDGLPYIGEVGNGQFLATGFAGNGTTFGTLAGMMACDAATGVANPWRDLFAVERKTLSAAWDYLRENSAYPFYLAKGLFAGTADDPATLAPGCGKILKVDGRKTAAFRDLMGETHLMSPICPHLGCVVRWNDAESTWDCPCHGSRFQATGEVIAGPAEKNLEKLSA